MPQRGLRFPPATALQRERRRGRAARRRLPSPSQSLGGEHLPCAPHPPRRLLSMRWSLRPVKVPAALRAERECTPSATSHDKWGQEPHTHTHDKGPKLHWDGGEGLSGAGTGRASGPHDGWLRHEQSSQTPALASPENTAMALTSARLVGSRRSSNGVPARQGTGVCLEIQVPAPQRDHTVGGLCR